jgi:predicted negative regulator of RcsB-dependent stress response
LADQAAPNTAGQLHEHALAAAKALSLVSTDLAHAGAPPEVTKAVAGMEKAMHTIIASMGKVQAAQPAPEQHTMDTAANGLVADVRARQAQP